MIQAKNTKLYKSEHLRLSRPSYIMEDSPFFWKWPSHNEDVTFESRSLLAAPAQRQRRNTFYSSATSRFELEPPSYAHDLLSYPYQSRQSSQKYRRYVYQDLEDPTPYVSMAMTNRPREKTVHDQSFLAAARSPVALTSPPVRETADEQTTEKEKSSTPSSSKRKRTAFTPIQLLVLETAFEKNHYVVGYDRKQLAKYLKLTETQVKVWFQNRRTKWKKTVLRPVEQMF